MTGPVAHGGEVVAALAAARRLETPCDGGSVVWHAWGDPLAVGRPVVLLHGGSGSWTHWARNVQALAAAGRHVLVPDLPGFGDSARPEGCVDADGLPVPLNIGLDVLVGSEPVDLVGFSFGGLTGGLMAARFPRRVARFVVIGAPGLGLASRRALGLRAWKHLPTREARRAIHRHNLEVLMLSRPDRVDEQAVDIQEANVPRDRMPARRLAFTRALAEALQTLQCPVHAIYGTLDVFYRGKQDALEAAIRGHAPTLQSLDFVEDAGHWVQYEQAGAFNALLQQRLAM